MIRVVTQFRARERGAGRGDREQFEEISRREFSTPKMIRVAFSNPTMSLKWV